MFSIGVGRPGTCHTFEANKVKKERYSLIQNNTLYTFSIKFSFSSIEQKSKLQKQISKLLILIEVGVEATMYHIFSI